MVARNPPFLPGMYRSSWDAGPSMGGFLQGVWDEIFASENPTHNYGTQMGFGFALGMVTIYLADHKQYSLALFGN